jgi:O-antigen/teichoic acid export membrane protein
MECLRGRARGLTRGMSGSGVGTFRRNIIWQLVGNGGQALLGGIILVLMGRMLGAHDFGVFAIVMSLVYVANGLFEPRMQDVAAKQFWDLDSGAVEHHVPYFLDLLIVEAIAKLVPCVALILLSPLLVSFNNLEGNGAIIPAAAVGFYLAKLGNGLALGTLRILGRSDLSSSALIGEQLLRLVLMIAILIFDQLTALNGIIVLCVAGIVANTAQWWMVQRQFRRVSLDIEGWTLAEALTRLRGNRRLLLSNMGLSISDLMNKDLDVTIISPLMSPATVGVYKMAKNIVILAWKAIDPVYLALMPEVNRLVARQQFDALIVLLGKIIVRMFALAVVLSAALAIGVWVLGEIVFGESFSEMRYYVPLMSIAILIGSPLIWAHPVLVALNRADAAVYGSLGAAAVGAGFLFLLTPVLGPYGAIVGWMVTFSLTFLLTAIAAYRRLLQVRRNAG